MLYILYYTILHYTTLYYAILYSCETILRGTNNTFNEHFEKQRTNAMRLCQRATILGALNIFRSVFGQV